jgi:4-hydroxybenzoate polyprenyltransferase
MAHETQIAVPADAVARTWVERAPASWRPYLRLARLDRPIGTWLLFWPCVFGLALGAATQHRGFLSTARDWRLLALFAIGAIVMRGAGCTYNDIVDHEIDSRVARTRGRPIPSGAVTVKQAWVFLVAQCAIGLLILLCLNPFSIALGAASLILIAIYPFMKRITWWPQAWLGLTFNWGALLGFAAETAQMTVPDLLLYAACLFWTLGYDTMYALQDIEDDALAGVKSTARLFGPRAPFWISIFYLGFAALAAPVLVLAFKGWILLCLLLPLAAHLFWQVLLLDPTDTQNCLRLFRANRETGALMAAALVAASWLSA